MRSLESGGDATAHLPKQHLRGIYLFCALLGQIPRSEWRSWRIVRSASQAQSGHKHYFPVLSRTMLRTLQKPRSGCQARRLSATPNSRTERRGLRILTVRKAQRSLLVARLVALLFPDKTCPDNRIPSQPASSRQILAPALSSLEASLRPAWPSRSAARSGTGCSAL